ncbi:MAG: methyl-accepting chemotaxis protein, partial [Gammaproteobacteria bacterium]|nr:methyl-accepting chemotaxis protein [Gammaproteobacteria bacterium]
MKWLDNLSVKVKLLIVLLAPLCGLLYFAQIEIRNNLELSEDLSHLSELTTMVTTVSPLVHEFQKERGASAVFIGSGGNRFKSELAAQRIDTDKKLAEYKSMLANFNGQLFGSTLQAVLSEAQQFIEQLPSKRQEASSLSVPSDVVIGYYTKMNSSLLAVVEQLPKLSKIGMVSVEGAAYANFLQSKERAGIERAVMAKAFSADDFADGSFSKFSGLMSQQRAYLASFKALATIEMAEFFEKTMNDPSVTEVERLRQVALNANRRTVVVNRVHSYLGYGGIIHHFKNYVLRGREKDLKKIYEDFESVNKLMDQVAAMEGLSDEAQQHVKTVKDIALNYKNTAETVAQLHKDNRDIGEIDKTVKISDGPALEAIAALAKGSFGIDPAHWFGAITKKINLLKTTEDFISKSLLDTTREMKETAESALYTSIIAAVVIALFAIGLAAWLVSRTIVRPLAQAVEVGQKVASGDLNVDIDSTSGDETGQVMAALKIMVGKLGGVVSQVQSATSSVASGGEEINSAGQQLSKGASQQAASLEEISSAMEQMASNIRQSADNAGQTEQIAKKAASDAREGGEA